MSRSALFISLLFSISVSAVHYLGQVRTEVRLNGQVAPVFFNDGDSFLVLAGPYEGTRARIAGFNTLESYGPVHQWGDWTAKELYVLAKKATLNAQRGSWNCVSSGEKDTYGRILWKCDDLAASQLERGLAHTMTVTRHGAEEQFQSIQRAAMAAKRGIWAHGVPKYILTSAHSLDEDFGKQQTYDRFVSTVDGHSEKVAHSRVSEPCSQICYSPDPNDATSSCIIYVNFKERYGDGKPPCLDY